MGLACLALLLLMPAAPASAYQPTYYAQPGYASQVTSYAQAVNGSYTGIARDLSMNVGGSAASASETGTISNATWRSRILAKTLPNLRVAGTQFALGVEAFALGWKIGRYVDTKWLHLSSSEVHGYTGGAVTSTVIQWTSIGSSYMWVVAVNIGAPVNGMSTAPYDCVSVTTVNPCTAQWRVDAANAVKNSGGGQLLVNTNDCSNGVCRIYRKLGANDDELARLLHVDTFKDWSGETPDVTTTGWSPSYYSQGFASQAAQNAAFTDAIGSETSDSPGQHLDNAVNSAGTVPDPLVDFSMPDCIGLSVSSCQAAIDADAAEAHVSVSYNVVTASVNDANLNIGADLIISTSPSPGTTGWPWPATITITKNPNPLPIIWPKANPDETYANYVARLRDLGWLGTASVLELDANTGDVDFGLDGVPCTSVPTGSRVPFDAPVTFLHNPTAGSFDDDLSPSSGPTCGDASATSESEPKCRFAQEHGSWESITAQNPLFFQVACESTRSYVASLNPFEADGTINTASITIARVIAEGDQIYDPDLRAAIVGGPYTIDDFNYVSSQRLFDDDGREFELHFFVNTVTGKAVLSRGFKIRWIYLFGPS